MVMEILNCTKKLPDSATAYKESDPTKLFSITINRIDNMRVGVDILFCEKFQLNKDDVLYITEGNKIIAKGIII